MGEGIPPKHRAYLQFFAQGYLCSTYSQPRWALEQEMWALLTVYQALRRAMVTAVESRPGTDLDRASFTTALRTARDLLVHADGITDDTLDLVGGIGRAVLAACTRPDDPAPASARSNPHSRATTRKTLPARTQHTATSSS
jgi:hypothetical protein